MEDLYNFFSPNQKRMLGIAASAKTLAWVGLIIYGFRAAVVGLQYQASLMESQPYYLANMAASILSLVFRGVVFYLALESVSLGLNMIVETDINYREEKIKRNSP